jgi:hypothetical protein
MVDDAEYADLMKKKARLPKTKFGDAFDPAHVKRINKLSEKNLA